MKKYLVIEVTPTHLKCVGIFANETDAAYRVARWNQLEGGFNPPEKIHYKMLAIDMADLTNPLEVDMVY